MGNTAKQCRLGLVQDSDFAGDLEDSKSTSGGTLCIFGCHTFVPISWMCKKQTSVSHISTESEIISLDAFFGWMEFQLLIFGICSEKCFILHQTNSTTPKIKYEETRRVTQHQASTPKTKPRIQSNAKNSDSSAMLYVFEDNEAVINIFSKVSHNEACFTNPQSCSGLVV